jgi:hypothetical protein
LVLGNGGVKSSQKVQDSPDAYPHFQIINDLAFAMKLKISQGKVKISENKLSGDLTFFTNYRKNEQGI